MSRLFEEAPEEVFAEGEAPEFQPEGYMDAMNNLLVESERLRKERNRLQETVKRQTAELDALRRRDAVLNRSAGMAVLERGDLSVQIKIGPKDARDQLVVSVNMIPCAANMVVSYDQVKNAMALGTLHQFAQSLAYQFAEGLATRLQLAVTVKLPEHAKD